MTSAPPLADLYGVVGDPIAHSLSPFIHNHWMRDAGLQAEYRGIHVPRGQFASGLDTLTREHAKGLNVTLPHKEDALAAAATASPVARKTGAANTLTRTAEGRWHADNTDAPGFLDALGQTYGRIGPDTNVLLLGAGGSARAIALALAEAGVALRIANRTTERAAGLIRDAGLSGGPMELGSALSRASDFHIVINTTSAGHTGEAFRWPAGHGRFLMDISYGKAAASNLSAASDAGWSVCDGLPMLVAQAAWSFEIWFGIRPDTEEALARCRKLVEGVGA